MTRTKSVATANEWNDIAPWDFQEELSSILHDGVCEALDKGYRVDDPRFRRAINAFWRANSPRVGNNPELREELGGFDLDYEVEEAVARRQRDSESAVDQAWFDFTCGLLDEWEVLIPELVSLAYHKLQGQAEVTGDDYDIEDEAFDRFQERMHEAGHLHASLLCDEFGLAGFDDDAVNQKWSDTVFFAFENLNFTELAQSALRELRGQLEDSVALLDEEVSV